MKISCSADLSSGVGCAEVKDRKRSNLLVVTVVGLGVSTLIGRLRDASRTTSRSAVRSTSGAVRKARPSECGPLLPGTSSVETIVYEPGAHRLVSLPSVAHKMVDFPSAPVTSTSPLTGLPVWSFRWTVTVYFLGSTASPTAVCTVPVEELARTWAAYWPGASPFGSAVKLTAAVPFAGTVTWVAARRKIPAWSVDSCRVSGLSVVLR